MISADMQKRVDRLRAQIDDLRYRYHVLNDPEVTDAMYDGLTTELRGIEQMHPEIVTPDSPTQRVAGKPLDKFAKVVHQVPQWSFNDAFSAEGMVEWEERILKILVKELGHRPDDLDYVCELKIDGLHMVLTYEDGLLQTAATRGDGKVGEDVTQNIRTIQTVPLRLKEPVDVVAEGEVWLGSEMLKKINKGRQKSGEPLFANPRNAAAGTIRQLDSRIVANRKLALTAYDISLIKEQGASHRHVRGPARRRESKEQIDTQGKELRLLKELGFYTDSHWRVCKTLADILAFHDEWQKKRASQPFWIDGIVVKVNQRKYQAALGFTGKAPRWAIAFKFPAEQATTRIKDIYVQVGRTGALTPVALMEPVALAGTTVTHATLHNFAEIKRLGVRIGDSVVVEKAGEIIPKVVRVLYKLRTGKEKAVRAPRVCPICRSPVERRDIGGGKLDARSAALFCTNANCQAQELGRIIHFTSKHAFDIDGLGEKIIAQLVQVGLIKNVADIFTLTVADLAPLERFADKSAQNLVTAITAARQVALPRFIYALGIPQVGEETAIRLANHFKTIEKLMRASFTELQEVEDIGPNVAGSIVEFFSSKDQQKLVRELIHNGVTVRSPKSEVRSQKFSGQSFVLTGTLAAMSRDEAKEKIRALGGEVSETVNKKTTYLVAGKNPGSKLDRARALGTAVIGELEFLKLLQ